MSYDIDPQRSDVPISVEELNALLAEQGRPLRDHHVATHVLQRTIIAIEDAQKRLTNLARDIQQLTSGQTAGRATTLSPVDALQYLSDDQKAKLFTATQRAQIDQARNARAEAEQYRARIVDFLTQATQARDWLATSDTPEPVRSQLTAMFDTLLGGPR